MTADNGIDAFTQGWMAFEEGVSKDANPHDPYDHPMRRVDWDEGWGSAAFAYDETAPSGAQESEDADPR